jgi:hypothetical protein
MANYYANSRSNYFRVRDKEAFKAFCETFNVEYIEDKDGRSGWCGHDDDCGGIPGDIYNEETGDSEDIDFPLEVSKHLCDGEVAIMLEVGNEKLCYIIGYAVAINSKGERKVINLLDIYNAAKELGPNVTVAES